MQYFLNSLEILQFQLCALCSSTTIRNTEGKKGTILCIDLRSAASSVSLANRHDDALHLSCLWANPSQVLRRAVGRVYTAAGRLCDSREVSAGLPREIGSQEHRGSEMGKNERCCLSGAAHGLKGTLASSCGCHRG